MTDRMGENGEVSSTPNAPPQQATQAWTVVASHGALVLGQSANEYAVYDQQNIFGRWPLTSEGYRYAVQTYESHQQSVAHGLAYTVTGYQDPARLGLPTEAVIKSKTYASPMSYVGSTRRIAAWMTKAAKRSPAYAVLAWVFGILAMLIMWVFLVFWYFVVFVLFGVFTFPYRFIRRSQRKNAHLQQTALATQQAILQQMTLQQHQALRQQQAAQSPSPTSLPPSAPPSIPSSRD